MTLQGCDVRLAGRGDANYEITACRTGQCNQFASAAMLSINVAAT